MFKLFRTKELNDDVDWELDVSPVTPKLEEQFQELTLTESYEVILERLDRIESKIEKLFW